MHILLRSVLFLFFTSLLSTSCSNTVSSVPLVLPADMQETTVSPLSAHTDGIRTLYAPLKALNKNARTGAIIAPEESDSMYFAFEQSPEMLGLTGSNLYALELEFEPLESTGKLSGTAPINTNSIQSALQVEG